MKKTHTIFSAIPAKIINFAEEKEEFLLYKLGVFPTKSSVISQISDAISQDGIYQENLELVELTPNTNYIPHYHKLASAIIYIILGEGVMRLGDDIIDYKPSLRVEIPAYKLHGFQTKSKTLFLSIQSPSIIQQSSGAVDLYYENR